MPDTNPEIYEKLYVKKNEIGPLNSHIISLSKRSVQTVMEVFPGTGLSSRDMALRKYDVVTVFNNRNCIDYFKNLLIKNNEIDNLNIELSENEIPNYKFDLIFCTSNELLCKYVLGKPALSSFLRKMYKRLKVNGSFILCYGLVKDVYSLFAKRKVEKPDKDNKDQIDGLKYKAIISPTNFNYIDQIITCNYFIRVTRKHNNEEASKPISKDIQRSIFTINDYINIGQENGFQCSVIAEGSLKVKDEDISKAYPYIVFQKVIDK